MSLPRQPITVAVTDVDRDRRQEFERLLKDDGSIALLANGTSRNQAGDSPAFVNRRLKSRADITELQNEVARIRRLKPLVLLINLDQCTDEDYALLLSMRRESPEAHMVLLTDDSINESQLLRAMEIGARGYLKYKYVQSYLSKAIQVVARGGIWASRKMMGNVIDYVLNY